MLLPILLGFVGQIIGIVSMTIAKRLRARCVDPRALLACYALNIPIWLCVLGYTWQDAAPLVSTSYLLNVASWVVLTFLFSIGTLYFLRYQSLSEANALSFSFSILVALIFDSLLFGQNFSIIGFGGVGLALAGAMILNRQRTLSLLFRTHYLALPKLLFGIFGLSFMSVMFLSIYKAGLQHMGDFRLFHVALSQTILFSLFALYGLPHLRQALAEDHIKPWHCLALAGCILLTNLIEASVVFALPIVFVVMFGLAKMMILAVVDVQHHQELRFKPQIGIALMCIAVGMVFLFFR